MNEYKPYKSQEVEKQVVAMREKLFKTNKLRDYNSQEQALIKEAYYQQGFAYGGRGVTLANGCASCFADAVRLLKNHINMYDKRYIEPEVKEIKIKNLTTGKEKCIPNPDWKVEKRVDIDDIKKTAFNPSTVKEYKEALKHIGVSIPHNAVKRQLIELWEQNR